MRKRTILGRLSLILLVLALLSVVVPVTSAASSKPVPVKIVTVGMTLDCAHMTPEAKKYADAHHYCDASKDSGGV